MTVSEELSNYAAGLRFEDLSEEVTHEAKRLLLDTLGVTIAGYPYESGKIVRSILGKLGGPEESTIIGSGTKTSCLNAILANGAMARYHDFQNMYISSNGVAAPSLHIPAILAVGEREEVSGKDLITAIFLNFELTGRFIDWLKFNTHNPPPGCVRWSSSTYTSFVVPLVVGKLLCLNQNQMANAMGISGSHNATLHVIDAHGEELNQTRNVVWAFASQSGYLAALLAQKGLTGPLRIIEGNHGLIHSLLGGECDVRHLIEGGDRAKILQTTYKSSCSCGAASTTIEATLRIVAEHRVKAEDVEKIEIHSQKHIVEHVGDPAKRFPENQETAGHSLHYLVSTAIIDGVIGPDQFSTQKLTDPKVHALIEKVTIDQDPELDKFPEEGATRVEILTKQGEKYSQMLQLPKGHYKQPLTDQDVEDKFRLCTSKFLSEEEITEIVDTIYHLEKIADARELTERLVF